MTASLPCRARSRAPVAFLLAAALLSAGGAGAEDWPQYRGAGRDGISSETGLDLTWGESGPAELWRVELGSGYSGMAVAGGRLFTLYGQDSREKLGAFDAATGKLLWSFDLDRERFDNFGNGPRSTPAVSGGMVYALGAQGKLAAVDAATGEVRWKHDLVQEFGAKVPQWGVASSPALEGEKLLLAVGAPGSSLMAFDKKTGKVLWASGDDPPGYSTAMVADLGGVRQAVFMTGVSAVSARLSDGKILWRIPWKTSYQVNAAMPLFVPPDRVFLSSGYDQGSALYKVSAKGEEVSADEVWASKVMKNHFNSSVRVGRYVYGFDNGILKCIDSQTGDEMWKARGYAKGSLLVADGHLIVLGEKGQLGVVEVTPEAFREKERFEVLHAKTWTMPTLADGRLFVRSERELVAYDLSGRAAGRPAAKPSKPSPSTR